MNLGSQIALGPCDKQGKGCARAMGLVGRISSAERCRGHPLNLWGCFPFLHDQNLPRMHELHKLSSAMHPDHSDQP